MTFFAILKLFFWQTFQSRACLFYCRQEEKTMKIRFYTTNKEAIVFDLEDILKQLNIKEQVATVGLVVEKDEAEVEAITQTIQDDYPNMYLQAKEYGRNLTLACAELPNPTNPDIVTYLYAGDDATETDSWIAKVNNTIRAQGDNSERLIHIDSNLAAVVEANETEQGYYASTVSQHDKATNEMLSFRQIAESLEAVGDNYKYQSTNNILTSRTKAERNYIVRLIKMYCDDTKYLSGAMPQSEYPFCVQNVDALNQRDAQWSEIKEYLAQDENHNKLDVILGFVPDAESDKTLILHSIEEKGKAMSDSEIEKAYNLLFGDCSNE
jgi:hypothetical protein